MYFGDLDDPNSDVSKALRSRKYKTLAPEAGTKPQIFYLV
jgi:Fe-S-cluster-containing dehydrogenase component